MMLGSRHLVKQGGKAGSSSLFLLSETNVIRNKVFSRIFWNRKVYLELIFFIQSLVHFKKVTKTTFYHTYRSDYFNKQL